jgi:tetratricopeptide (TPR) repeat protein
MKPFAANLLVLSTILIILVTIPPHSQAGVKAWEGILTIPTYLWDEDVNPQFWALQGANKFSTTIHSAITYPYVMQDHISRTKVDRTYKALFLENEYLKVTCLPELGGRLHSVLDKSTGKETFHLNRVIKPGMIAMRGAFISGGVEWNTGPHGHTVTIVSPVNALAGSSPDGSAHVEISNQEQIFRTRWTVRVTLHPGRAYLDEQIRLYNPTDGMHPYYFWNCTAFPNRPGTRFIYPMSLGTDHNARKFFRWPFDNGRDMSWLKNYPTYMSVFAVDCTHDFFGAYDVNDDQGIVQTADHRQLGGKKAWTWGEWDYGKVAQRNLTDEDGPYIEVQSGPLPTQSDYGMLGPREQVAWQEWWYPVHGLGNGFEYATRDVAVGTTRRDGRLEVRILATGRFPRAACLLKREGRTLLCKELDLSPMTPGAADLSEAPQGPIDVTVRTKEGRVLAAFTTPLPIPKVDPPDPAKFVEKPEDQLTVEELYLKGRKFDRSTDRLKARQYYGKALARDPGHVASLRSLAVLDFESGLYGQAAAALQKALGRDGDDGLCWFYLGACRLRLQDFQGALLCGYRAARLSGTASIGYDLAGRAAMRLGDLPQAVAAFEVAVSANPKDPLALDHLMLALYAAHRGEEAARVAERRCIEDPTALVPRALRGLQGATGLAEFARQARAFCGEPDFELLETSLTFAELGMADEAARILRAGCVYAAPAFECPFMPLYYLAWYASLRGDVPGVRRWLVEAVVARKPTTFASRPEEVEILRFAVNENGDQPQSHFQLGCLMANLGRMDEAVSAWRKAAELNPKLSVAWRNLGLAAATIGNDLAKGEEFYRKAVAARPNDQTLYRDLAAVLVAASRRSEAVRLLENMPLDGVRRGEITVMLAEAYVNQRRYDDCIKLLESTPYYVNWEGQDLIWRLFNHAHVDRGRQRLEKGDAKGALADFEAALTYPANLNVGRSDRPQEAPAQYWRGRALAALGRMDDARAAWQAGAASPAWSVREASMADAGDTRLPRLQNEYREKCREALAGGKN